MRRAGLSGTLVGFGTPFGPKSNNRRQSTIQLVGRRRNVPASGSSRSAGSLVGPRVPAVPLKVNSWNSVAMPSAELASKIRFQE